MIAVIVAGLQQIGVPHHRAAPEVTVLWATLAAGDIEKAKAELALREGISSRNISI